MILLNVRKLLTISNLKPLMCRHLSSSTTPVQESFFKNVYLKVYCENWKKQQQQQKKKLSLAISLACAVIKATNQYLVCYILYEQTIFLILYQFGHSNIHSVFIRPFEKKNRPYYVTGSGICLSVCKLLRFHLSSYIQSSWNLVYS